MKCAKCPNRITEDAPGGLLFSPPEDTLDYLGWSVRKHHLCPKCYGEVLDFIRTRTERRIG